MFRKILASLPKQLTFSIRKNMPVEPLGAPHNSRAVFLHQDEVSQAQIEYSAAQPLFKIFGGSEPLSVARENSMAFEKNAIKNPNFGIDLQSGISFTNRYSAYARSLKDFVRRLRYAEVTHRWLGYWNSSHSHAQLACATPFLMQKIYRKYQSTVMSSADRLSLLVSHYDFIFSHGLAPLVLKAAVAPVNLGRFYGKVPFDIRILSIRGLGREGELTLGIFQGQTLVFSIAFTCYKDTNISYIRVGALQGPSGEQGKEIIKKATKNMFGQRPKWLLIELVRAIAAECGFTSLILTSNQNRIWGKKIHADYDGFWVELGAFCRPDGDFQLNISSLSSGHRGRRKCILRQTAISITRAYFRRTPD